MSTHHQQVGGELFRPGVRLEVSLFLLVPHLIPSGVLGLASVFWGPQTFGSTDSERKWQAQDLVAGPTPNPGSSHLS